MRRPIPSLMLTVVLLSMLVMIGPSGVGSAQSRDYPLDNCGRGCFSTEEDFMMTKGEPYDGNPYISDGDLLSIDGKVCARNADLLLALYPQSAPSADLGLDAVDILDVAARLVAFSTELDDPMGQFSAGDLLLTNGGIIPNQAIVYPFGIQHDIGLDAVQFVGEESKIVSFAGLVVNIGAGNWEGARLKQELVRYEIDLWFSIEGTHQIPGAAMILDGDLLSAATGTVITKQANMLPSDVPAGLPQRGVDFGLDALASVQLGTRVPFVYFSTEILYRGDKTPFTDGDMLLRGNGVVVPNKDLVAPFYPAANFLGLDALDIGAQVGQKIPRITQIGQISVSDIDGGEVAVGGTGTGLAMSSSYMRPYGRWIPIYGEIPSSVDEFRVVYRKAGTTRPTDPATAPGIAVVSATGWKAADWNPVFSDCSAWTPYSSDADGWYDTGEYRRLELGEGMIADCNGQLALTVWNSFDDATVDTEGHYVIWLQWRIGAGAIQEESYDHHIQFDNKAPENLDLAIPGGACTDYGPGDMPVMVEGHVDDPHFWRYRLRIFGGNPPVGYNYAIVNHDDAGTEAANVGPTGTGAGLVDLHEVKVSSLPASSVITCCYGIRLWVEDRTIIGSFDPGHNQHPWGYGFEDAMEITFAYTP